MLHNYNRVDKNYDKLTQIKIDELTDFHLAEFFKDLFHVLYALKFALAIAAAICASIDSTDNIDSLSLVIIISHS